MKLGIYSIEIHRPSVEELFEAIKDYGFSQVQSDFSSACEEQMPGKLDPKLVKDKLKYIMYKCVSYL